MSTKHVAGVPDDFPRGGTAPTVPGAQPKFIAREINGRFVAGFTDDELRDRWAYCEDLAQQLKDRTLRKQADGLVSNLETFFADTERRVRGQGWDLSNDEVIWLMRRTRALASEAK